jgi:hypothetical protein
MTNLGMGDFAREDVRNVLSGLGITAARRAVGTDVSEEVILLAADDFRRIEPEAVARALMKVLPQVKVWVIQEHQAWTSEPL